MSEAGCIAGAGSSKGTFRCVGWLVYLTNWVESLEGHEALRTYLQRVKLAGMHEPQAVLMASRSAFRPSRRGEPSMQDRMRIDVDFSVTIAMSIAMWNSWSLVGVSAGGRQRTREYVDNLLELTFNVGVVEARGSEEELGGLPSSRRLGQYDAALDRDNCALAAFSGGAFSLRWHRENRCTRISRPLNPTLRI